MFVAFDFKLIIKIVDVTLLLMISYVHVAFINLDTN